MSKITNDQLNTVWHRMLYSCTHLATVGVCGVIEQLSDSKIFVHWYKIKYKMTMKVNTVVLYSG